MKPARLSLAVALMAMFLSPWAAWAADPAPPSQVAWRLLDYLAVDYEGAVENGQVKNESEFAEMQEFSANVEQRLVSLPSTPAKAALLTQSQALQAAIARKAPPSEVAQKARELGAELLAAYPTPVAPASPPDLARGARLYAQTCAVCHGATGRGDGAGARGLDPPPIAFTDLDRARQRSLFGLYQVISQGVDGTSMASFADLPSQDRWALAFYVGSLAFDESIASAGERAWRTDARTKAEIPNLQSLTQKSSQALEPVLGRSEAEALVAYLRRHPEALAESLNGSLAVARAHIAESLKAYRAGDRDRAGTLALAAYLDGFEPVEPALTAHDEALMRRVESAMSDFRVGIKQGTSPDTLEKQATRLSALLDAAERALGPGAANPWASFAGAMTILLREGLEALLLVVAMIAFLRKANRMEALPYVHGGWIAALVAGALTWAGATWLIAISGASRELTEGVGSLIAAGVLISVGVWMHGKSKGNAWQTYIREKMGQALSSRSAWLLFLLAFVVVYREVFETILFYAALWSQGAHMALLGGTTTAIAALGLIAWALLHYSKRLPIGKFFAYSAALIAVLAVVLTGKGVAALQETGLLDIMPVSNVPRVELLGLFPTWEGVAAQLLVAIVLGVGFFWSGGRARTAAKT